MFPKIWDNQHLCPPAYAGYHYISGLTPAEDEGKKNMTHHMVLEVECIHCKEESSCNTCRKTLCTHLLKKLGWQETSNNFALCQKLVHKRVDTLPPPGKPYKVASVIKPKHVLGRFGWVFPVIAGEAGKQVATYLHALVQDVDTWTSRTEQYLDFIKERIKL
jgi:hypothetical protein